MTYLQQLAAFAGLLCVPFALNFLASGQLQDYSASMAGAVNAVQGASSGSGSGSGSQVEDIKKRIKDLMDKVKHIMDSDLPPEQKQSAAAPYLQQGSDLEYLLDTVEPTGVRLATPDEIITIRYDAYANLVARGIIASPRRYPTPSAFPGNYVPDPS